MELLNVFLWDNVEGCIHALGMALGSLVLFGISSKRDIKISFLPVIRVVVIYMMSFLFRSPPHLCAVFDCQAAKMGKDAPIMLHVGQSSYIYETPHAEIRLAEQLAIL